MANGCVRKALNAAATNHLAAKAAEKGLNARLATENAPAIQTHHAAKANHVAANVVKANHAEVNVVKVTVVKVTVAKVNRVAKGRRAKDHVKITP